MSTERRIEELITQADKAGLMGDFRAGRLSRSAEPADVAELPVPDAQDVESAELVMTTFRLPPEQKVKLVEIAKERNTDVSRLLREWVGNQIDAHEHPERKLITVDEAMKALQNLPHSA